MTICIAAICEGYIIGASDRLITSGDIQFLPAQAIVEESARPSRADERGCAELLDTARSAQGARSKFPATNRGL